MPAETHRHGEPVNESAVLSLIWALIARPSDAQTPDPATTLRHLDVDDDIAVLQLWDAATEEFAERTVAEPDIEPLLAAATIGDLAEAITRSLRGDGPEPLPPSGQPGDGVTPNP